MKYDAHTKTRTDYVQPLLESFLSLSLSEDRLQPADELGCKPLRLYVDVLWHAMTDIESCAIHDITPSSSHLHSSSSASVGKYPGSGFASPDEGL
ncbi:hypothetical protein EYF80_043609 [Liparis tanakae]|uniref:Uncharacterized protein n=1 Tax=Liparis tanakae TaxID=230148 RepID=A0A4Z2FZ60_9TELE|nr:hypothetical protein EYF80_043609 [Liparis tanakae]